ncbi:MAG: zinc ribbon domain-containing protein [Candidatus Hodarchaeales archaeon]
MNIHEKKAIVYLIISAGVITILIGIFGPFEFINSLIPAVVLFILSGVVATFLDIHNQDESQASSRVQTYLDLNQRRAIVYAIGGLGVIVLFIGIFAPRIDFDKVIVPAIALFLFSWIIATYLGLDNGFSNQVSRSNRIRYVSQPVGIQNRVQYSSQSAHHVPSVKPYYGEPTPKYVKPTPKTTISSSNFCSKCGHKRQGPEDIFCYSCGTKLA